MKIDREHVRSRYALGCFLCLCFGPVGPLFWFVVAGTLTKRSNFEVGACSIYGIISTFCNPKKGEGILERKGFLAPFRFLFFGGYVQSPLLASVQGFGDRLRYALLQAKRSAGKPSARGTSGTAPEMQ